MQWDDGNFRKNAAMACEKAGFSQRWLLKQVGCSHDYLQTKPAHGRRIDKIYLIADKTGAPIVDLLGLPVTAQIDAEILLIAYEATPKAIELVAQPTAVIFVETMAALYTVLLSRRADGHDPHDPEYLKLVIDIFRARAAVSMTRPS